MGWLVSAVVAGAGVEEWEKRSRGGRSPSSSTTAAAAPDVLCRGPRPGGSRQRRRRRRRRRHAVMADASAHEKVGALGARLRVSKARKVVAPRPWPWGGGCARAADRGRCPRSAAGPCFDRGRWAQAWGARDHAGPWPWGAQVFVSRLEATRRGQQAARGGVAGRAPSQTPVFGKRGKAA